MREPPPDKQARAQEPVQQDTSLLESVVQQEQSFAESTLPQASFLESGVPQEQSFLDRTLQQAHQDVSFVESAVQQEQSFADHSESVEDSIMTLPESPFDKRISDFCGAPRIEMIEMTDYVSAIRPAAPALTEGDEEESLPEMATPRHRGISSEVAPRTPCFVGRKSLAAIVDREERRALGRLGGEVDDAEEFEEVEECRSPSASSHKSVASSLFASCAGSPMNSAQGSRGSSRSSREAVPVASVRAEVQRRSVSRGRVRRRTAWPEASLTPVAEPGETPQVRKEAGSHSAKRSERQGHTPATPAPPPRRLLWSFG